MVITFTNKHGTLRLNGGGTDNAWRILEISGIGFPKKHFTYHQYAGIFGQTLNTVSIPNRTITISGDILESARSISLARVMRIVNEDGELRIQTGKKSGGRSFGRSPSNPISEKTLSENSHGSWNRIIRFFTDRRRSRFRCISESPYLKQALLFRECFPSGL